MAGLLQKIRTREVPVVSVATKHIPYIETLWARLEGAKTAQRTREEYVRAASQMGLKLKALEHVADKVLADPKGIRAGEAALLRVKMVLAAGCEPTTPPAGWYCGALREPKKVKSTDGWDNEIRRFPRETWPDYRTRWSSERTVSTYVGPIPIEVIQKLAVVEPLVDDIRVYSPREEDFRANVNPQPRDPVAIGAIDLLGERHYFELARWDIDSDLATVFERV